MYYSCPLSWSFLVHVTQIGGLIAGPSLPSSHSTSTVNFHQECCVHFNRRSNNRNDRFLSDCYQNRLGYTLIVNLYGGGGCGA